MIVVDASVAVKWLLPETNSDAAQKLLATGQELTAPSLIRLEVAAAITRKVRMGELSPDAARLGVELWLQSLTDGVLVLMESQADLENAVDLAFSLRHPLQGCLYLALARRLDVALITADPKFVHRAAAEYPNVRLLGAKN